MISEEYVQDSFHSYLKSSLAQAKAERLLDVDVLSSAEADLMITGPALCLYFAALRCTTNPPSVPLPRSVKSSSGRDSSQPADLSLDNCPMQFLPFLKVWASNVPPIQALVPEHQHDLAHVVCRLEPVSSPLSSINGIAADLRAVTIEISQHRSFQDRYASDLQAALDAGSSGHRKKVSFVPPPVYDPSPQSSPRTSFEESVSASDIPPPLPPKPQNYNQLAPSPLPSSSRPKTPPSPSSLRDPDTPAIDLIRETLYAALATVLESHKSLARILKSDRPRTYFAAVAYAILYVSMTSLSLPTDNVNGHDFDATVFITGVLGQQLTLARCPVELQPFMRELALIGREARQIEEEDSSITVKYLQRGEHVPSGTSRMEKVDKMLEGSVGYAYRPRSSTSSSASSADEEDSGSRRRSLEGCTVAFVNRINALSLGMTKLSAFKERQDDVFKVLTAVASSR